MSETVEHNYPRDAITTSEGIFNYSEPLPEQVTEKDISIALSRQPRYGGHTYGFYSVAQHSVAVAKLLEAWDEPEDIQFHGLMHDAAEAYCGDVPRPLKRKLDKYGEIYERTEKVIAYEYKLLHPFPQVVKQADDRMYEYERRGISDHPDADATDISTPPELVVEVICGYWRPKKAKRKFRALFNKLSD